MTEARDLALFQLSKALKARQDCKEAGDIAGLAISEGRVAAIAARLEGLDVIVYDVEPDQRYTQLAWAETHPHYHYDPDSPTVTKHHWSIEWPKPSRWDRFTHALRSLFR